jgi:hypothetical protein
MNRIILLAFAALAFAVPPVSDAAILPLVPLVHPNAVCDAIQALEHDICNNNNPIAALCDALSELNSTLRAGKPFKDIPVQKICPLLDFIDAELCPNGTATVKINVKGDIPVQKICPLLNFIDTELCPHARQNKERWLKKIDGLFYKHLYDSSDTTHNDNDNEQRKQRKQRRQLQQHALEPMG